MESKIDQLNQQNMDMNDKLESCNEDIERLE